MNKLRSAAARYAVRDERHPDSGIARLQNRGRLDAVITACRALRPHLEQRSGQGLDAG